MLEFQPVNNRSIFKLMLLRDAGVEMTRIFADKATGVNTERDGVSMLR